MFMSGCPIHITCAPFTVLEVNLLSREDEKRKGKMTVEEAGRKGGEKVAEERGPEFYSEIGRKGGESRGRQREEAVEARGKEGGAEAGRRGGEARARRREEE